MFGKIEVRKYLSHSMQNILSSSLLSKNMKIKIYRTIILPVVLYGCETWSVMLKEECGLRFFENMMLKKLFGTKRGEVAGMWRRLRNKELYALNFSANIIRVIKWRRLRWAGHVARMKTSGGAYGVLVGKLEGSGSLWRPRRRWEDSITLDFQEVVWGGIDRIDLAEEWDRWRAPVNAVLNLRVV